MRYRIEFLKESTDEYSVCKTAEVESDLGGAELQAWLEAERIKPLFASGGFQIRDLTDGGRIVATVADSIRKKIAWPAGNDDAAFLNAYYARLRARLERGLLFGQRRADKNDQRQKT